MIALFATQTVALAADPPNQPFDLIYRVEDVKYRIYQDGVGMLGRTEGTLTDAPLPGTSIVKAYLVWAGLGRDNDGILFQRVGNGASVRHAGCRDDVEQGHVWRQYVGLLRQ
ncbi:MAG: hypothetical protein R2838_10375 [Caldilineaceae bacterium]